MFVILIQSKTHSKKIQLIHQVFMKNYFNRWEITVIFILTSTLVLAQKPPKQEVYRPEPTLVVLSQDQSYARNNLSVITQDFLGLDSSSALEMVNLKAISPLILQFG